MGFVYVVQYGFDGNTNVYLTAEMAKQDAIDKTIEYCNKNKLIGISGDMLYAIIDEIETQYEKNGIFDVDTDIGEILCYKASLIYNKEEDLN